MLTDDGKHLYVSWDEYHMLIERLALKVHSSGWQFDQILCLARGGMRPGDVLSRVFDKPLAIMSTSSYRAEAGTIQGRLDIAKYITMPKGELAGRVLLVDDLADSGVTLQRGGRAAARHAVDQRTALGGDLDQGRVDLHARLLRRAAAHQPVDPPAVRGVRQPAPRRAGEEVRRSEQAAARTTEQGPRMQPARSRPSDILVPRKGLEPPRSYPLVPETSASTNSATWAFQEPKDFIIKETTSKTPGVLGAALDERSRGHGRKAIATATASCVRDDGEPDIYLSPQEMRAVLHRDRVRVRIVRYDRKGRPEGRVLDIIERAQGADHRPPAARERHLARGARRPALRPGHPGAEERHRQRRGRAGRRRSS